MYRLAPGDTQPYQHDHDRTDAEAEQLAVDPHTPTCQQQQADDAGEPYQYKY